MPQVIRFDHARASQAFATYSAMRKAERADPTLGSNSDWRRTLQGAYDRFMEAFDL